MDTFSLHIKLVAEAHATPFGIHKDQINQGMLNAPWNTISNLHALQIMHKR